MWSLYTEDCLSVCREDQEITVQEPRTVMEKQTVQVPMMQVPLPWGTVPTFSNYATVKSTKSDLVYNGAPDDAISA
jgi:hypothetical protein